MELSSDVQRGLQAAGSGVLTEQVFEKLVREAVQDSIGPGDASDLTTITEVDQAILKEAHASLMTLALEAARTDSDSAIVSTALEECKFAPDRIKVFTSMYADNKAKIRASLGRVGSTVPHVVDVNWRLDYYIKSNHLDRVNKPVYLIELRTEQGDQHQQGKVQFSCTQEELQDLVSKLKDASKSLEKFSQKP